MGQIFNTILVHPLLNALVYLYNYIPDIGIVIIILTVVVRLILYPSFHKSLKHQRALQALQPKMQEIKEKYKNDQQQQAAAMMELYKIHKVNPVSSCLPVLLQLPILIALYQVFIQSLNGQELRGLYSFIENPGQIDPMFLDFINLSVSGNFYLAGLAAILQYFQTRMTQNKMPVSSSADQTTMLMTKYMMYFIPAITFFFGVRFPAGLALYWVTTTVFGIGQQYYILKREAQQVLEAKVVN